MSKEKSVRKLRGYSLLTQLTSLLVFAIGALSIILFFQPSIIGVGAESMSEHRGQWIWLASGLIFIALAIFFNTVVYRWPRFLLRILRTQPSSTMRFQLKISEGDDRAQYYAYLTEVSSASYASTWCIRLWAVSKEIEGWIDRVCSAKVFRDPENGDPVIIELEDMYLWAMKGEVQRISLR